MANALADRSFDPERPSFHASYVYMCGHDWSHAVTAVLETPGYACESALLARLVEARRRDGELAFRAVHRLLCRDDIEARKAARAAAPWLLECYLGLQP